MPSNQAQQPTALSAAAERPKTSGRASMLAHGFEPQHVVALGFGVVGAIVGVWGLVCGLRGRPGSFMAGGAALACSAVVLLVPLTQYYADLAGLESEDLGGYDSPGAALEYVLDRGFGYVCLPAAALG